MRALAALPPVGKRSCMVRGHAVEGFTVGLQKAQRPIVEPLNLHLALVHLPVMEAAELDVQREAAPSAPKAHTKPLPPTRLAK
jgi:hypothetical protein